MTRFDPSDQSRPVLHLGEHPLYAPHVIVLVYAVTMLLTTACLALKVNAPFGWLPFSSAEVLQGQVWRVLTYGLLNEPSLWFVVDMFMLAWFGRELEKFFGQQVFLQLFTGLYLLTPLLFTGLGLLGWPLGLTGQAGTFGFFIAFATLYPGLTFFLNLPAKWLAFILVGIYTLMHLAGRNLPGLVTLWAGTGFAHGFVRYQQGRFTLPNLFAGLRRPKFKVLPGQAAKASGPSAPPTGPAMADIDALLDKIARSGIHSLTREERARLDHSSSELMKRKGAGRGPQKP